MEEASFEMGLEEERVDLDMVSFALLRLFLLQIKVIPFMLNHFPGVVLCFTLSRYRNFKAWKGKRERRRRRKEEGGTDL